MATYFGTQATKTQNSAIMSLAEQGHVKGRIHSAHDSFTLTGDLSAGDVIKMAKIPAGARIVDARLAFTDLDAAGGTLNVGWQAGATGAEAANATGFLSAVDVTSAGSAGMFSAGAQAAGYQKVFSEEVQAVVAIGGDTDAVTGTIDLEIFYVVD